jgi:predicted PurR-regulated permease PerM
MENKTKPQHIFFLILFAALFVLVARIFSPFLGIIMWAALIYIIISPLYNKVIKNIQPIQLKNAKIIALANKMHLKQSFFDRLHRNFWAVLFTIASLALFFGLMGLLLVELSRQIVFLLRSLIVYVELNPQFVDFNYLQAKLNSLNIPYINTSNFNIRGNILNFIRELQGHIMGFISTFVSGTGRFLLSCLFMMFSLFFFLAEGSSLMTILVRALPIQSSYSLQFIARFREVSKGILIGLFLTGIVQGLFAFIIFSAFNIQAAFAWAVLVTLASFFPMVGASLIYIPLTVMHFTQMGLGSALLFLALCMMLISTVETFVKPLLLGERVNTHPLIILFSLLGGIQFFGINGLVLGPLVVTLFFTSIDIFIRDNPE